MHLDRREFLTLSGLGALALSACGGSAYGAPGIAEAEVADTYAKLIPAHKGLDPAWVRSLTERGWVQPYTDRTALDHIGMPVGGLYAGTVYLGGDGRLWLWNILNNDQEGILPRPVPYQGRNIRTRDGANYVSPAPRTYPFEQNFGVRMDGRLRTLDADGFAKVSFLGQYPMGEVTYQDEACPVAVSLSAFSPFIPLNVADSSLPVTVMSYTLHNRSRRPVECDVLGWLENPVCLHSARQFTGARENAIVRDSRFSALSCTATPADPTVADARPDILFEDFERETYGDWTVTGEAFGAGPVRIRDVPGYQGALGATGKRVVNSHASAPGGDVNQKDRATGTLMSPEFTVTRRFVNVLIGGGSHHGRTCVNVVADGEVKGSITGDDRNAMGWKTINVATLEGERATIHIVDGESGGWGNIGVDQVVFSDSPPATGRLEQQPDFGSMTLAVLAGRDDDVLAAPDRRDPVAAESAPRAASAALAHELTGSVGRSLLLQPGASETVHFVLAWHFPNLTAGGMKNVGREYAARFENALAVARYVAKEFARLSGDTRLWRDTWYDSTLPHWFLDRTMANTSILATTTAYRFKDGRFWAWEGIGCCNGTCTHVWHYAQAPGRLFPEVERQQREKVDFGISLHSDGGIGMRSNLTGANHPADDGHCGRILGAYREHQMSEDNAFLQRTWPRIKRAIQFMIDRDTNRDGILEGAQHNTLDAAWYGRISFLASLYLATLRAGEAMAAEMGDTDFAAQCKAIADKGAATILELYNGEYFFHELDPAHIDNVATGTGCYIDQVFGQFWAHQLGLGHLFDPAKIKSALSALYRYNFVPKIGPFRDTFTRGRWYATDDDKGLIMCTWPKGGLNKKWHDAWQFGYFNECMTGFEWQAAAHMIAEGLVEEGMAVARAIHDRYDASLRNPYNEIECSDHYSRAMASYGAFLAACGYESHGPRGHLGFAPKVRDGDAFKCAFTAAGGWGSYEEKADGKGLKACLRVKWGRVTVKTLGITMPEAVRTVAAELNGKPVEASIGTVNGKARVEFDDTLHMNTGDAVTVAV